MSPVVEVQRPPRAVRHGRRRGGRRPDAAGRARRSPWSGATAPASRPRCGCWPACCRRPPARCGSRAWTSGPTASAVKERVGYCPDVGGLIPRATPWEHLALSAKMRRLPAGLGAAGRATCSTASTSAARPTGSPPASRTACPGGCRCCSRPSTEPDVLLLDEPFDGVDPLGVEATMDLIRELRLGGVGGPHLDPPARPRRAGLRGGRRPAPGLGRRRLPRRRAQRRRGRRPLPLAAVVSAATPGSGQLRAPAGAAVADAARRPSSAAGWRSRSPCCRC